MAEASGKVPLIIGAIRPNLKCAISSGVELMVFKIFSSLYI
jgi:hypothetical protein